MKRPDRKNYRPFDLCGDTAIAKWYIDYSTALDKYIDFLESKTLKKVDIEVRKQDFMMEVANFKGNYPDDMLREFYDYWTEHGANDRKFRKEKEKSFDIGKRLARWFKNYKPSNQISKDQKTVERIKQNLEGW